MTINEAVEVLRKYYGCRTTTGCGSLGDLCDRCEYDVDADTVTEALKTVLDTFGICSVLLNTSQTKFKPGDKFLLEIGEKRIGLDEYSIVGTDLYVWGSLLEKLTPYEADGDVEFWKRRVKDYENTVSDLVSKMTKGVKFNCMEMNAEGLTFREEKPSVQAERKKGKWIPVDDPSITGRCSVCGFESHLCEDDVYGYDYCPNCGARLEVIDDE